MLNINKITPVETTILRRVNRKFQIVPKGQRIEAVSPLPVQTKREGQVITRTFDKIVVIENDGKEFRAECYIVAQWKRTYWRRWRSFKKDVIRIRDENYNALIKRLKDALYTEIEGATKITEETAREIISNRALIGLFWFADGKGYTAIDNDQRQAFTEHFRTIEEVKNFLFNEDFYVSGESNGFSVFQYEFSEM